MLTHSILTGASNICSRRIQTKQRAEGRGKEAIPGRVLLPKQLYWFKRNIEPFNIIFALLQDQKKLESILLKEKEAIFGSKGSPKRAVSLNRRTNGYRSSGTTSGLMTPNPRRSSLGGATPELLTPRSCSGHYNRYFSDSRRLSATQLNFGDDSLSTFTSISGSEPESPSLG